MNQAVKDMVSEAKDLRLNILKQMSDFSKKYNVVIKPTIWAIGDPKDGNTKLCLEIIGNIKEMDPELDYITGYIID